VKLSHLGRILRTVRHLRPVQIVAQIVHLFGGEARVAAGDGGQPTRSVEHAAVPFLPAPAHAYYDGGLGFKLLSRHYQFRDEVDWEFQGEGPLWSFHLHQFDYARGRFVVPGARWRLIDDWIERCHEGPGWAPHPISLRILSWGKLLLTQGALELDDTQRARIHASLADQAQTLAGTLETRLQANHLLSNILSVVFAGLLFDDAKADAWLALESDLKREIALQVLPDGAHIERSPMYHALLLENLLDLLNLARASDGRASASLLATLEDATARMLGAHRVWTHPDGEIALFGDAAFDIAHPPAALEAYAKDLGVVPVGPSQPTVLGDAGIYRMEVGELVLIATAKEPLPAYQPGHAHCDALSFELSVGEDRVVTDTGVSEYIPGILRDISRETASHATVRIDDCEQSEVWAAHRVGGRAKVVAHHVSGDRVELACTTWSKRGTQHRRSFRRVATGIEIEDSIEGTTTPIEFTLPLAPGLAPRLVAAKKTGAVAQSAHRLEIRLPGGKTLFVELPAGVAWKLVKRPYFPRFGENVERSSLVGKADDFRSGIWKFGLEGKG
jgi:hypothetical protein